MWEAAGSRTVAEQEIIKLRAAVADKSTNLDYCAALDAVHRRDRTIYVLEKELVQQAKDSEFNQETVDSLADLLMSLGDRAPVEAVHDLEAWAVEREARFDDFVTHSGPVVIAAQQDACLSHRNTIDLQHKLLINALETRDRQGKTIAEVKPQLAALVAKEEHNIKIYNPQQFAEQLASRQNRAETTRNRACERAD
jgi:chorismate mutase